MMEAVNPSDLVGNTQSKGSEQKKILYWKKNERMGGMVPVWGTDNTAKANIEKNLTQAAATTKTKEKGFDAALAYAATDSAPDTDSAPQDKNSEEFGFGDLLDMVNPLQHLPLISYLYRQISGDEIKPVSKIIGGGLYGGMIGAAASLVDTAIEYETGKGVSANIAALVTEGTTPHYRSENQSDSSDQPEKALNKALENRKSHNPHNLPGSVIGFSDLGFHNIGHGKQEMYKPGPVAHGRTAGTMIRKYTEIAPPDPTRDPIKRVVFKNPA